MEFDKELKKWRETPSANMDDLKKYASAPCSRLFNAIGFAHTPEYDKTAPFEFKFEESSIRLFLTLANSNEDPGAFTFLVPNRDKYSQYINDAHTLLLSFAATYIYNWRMENPQQSSSVEVNFDGVNIKVNDKYIYVAAYYRDENGDLVNLE